MDGTIAAGIEFRDWLRETWRQREDGGANCAPKCRTWISATGMIRAETSDAITLQPATGEPIVIPKDRVRNRRQTSQSLMPEGLEAAMTPQALADLIAYLKQPR